MDYLDEEKLLENVEKLFTRWQNDLVAFVREGLGVDGRGGVSITKQQEEGCREISKLINAKRKKNIAKLTLTPEEEEYSQKIGVSIMSGQGTGKDALAAWIIIYLLVCFRDVLIPCTAPSADQLKVVLWAEVSRWLTRKDEKGEDCINPLVRDAIVVQSDKIFHKYYDGKKNFAFAKTANPKDDIEAQAKTLYGFHEKYMMIVVEEAAGVLEPVFKPLEGTLTREVNFALLMFNPIYSTGYAIETHLGKNSSRWVCLHWDSEESEIVSKDHIQAMAEKYGRDSNTFRTLVKGYPPKTDVDAIIGYEWVQAAAHRDIIPLPDDPMIGGLDPGAGGDNSVLTVRQGMKVFPQLRFSSPNTMELVSWAAEKYDEYELAVLIIDIIGIGKGVGDRLRELGYNIIFFDSRKTASNSDMFYNKRTEMWWNGRKIFEEGGISIPDDIELKSELWSPRIKKDHSTRTMRIESKYEMKKHLQSSSEKSPNKADSLLMCLMVRDSMYRRMGKDIMTDDDDDPDYYEKPRMARGGRYAWMTR